MLSHLSDTSVSIRNLKFLSDIFVSSFKHWSTLPTYPFALSSDSIIISQFLLFVKSFFCELSVICSRLALPHMPFIARLCWLSLTGMLLYHNIPFLSIPFFDLYFSPFFAVFLAVVSFFGILPFFPF